MKLGMNLLLWTDHVTEAHLPVIEKLAKIGFDGVELPVFMGDEKHYRKLGKQLKSLGLGSTTVLAMGPDQNPVSPDAKVRAAALDALKAGIDRSAALGATIIAGPMHSALGVFSGTGPTSAELNRSADVLRAAGKHAKSAKITIAVEYLNRFENYLLTTMADTAKFIDKIDHPSVKLMFDTFHSHIEEKDSTQAIRTAGKRMVHVHVSENDRGVPGTGQVHWLDVMKELRCSGYDGWLTIESFGRALPNLAAATRVWRDLAPSQEDVAVRGHQFIRAAWATAK
jgi:D-psicose/D-tagatose/L-ribulose 3-epimerase